MKRLYLMMGTAMLMAMTFSACSQQEDLGNFEERALANAETVLGFTIPENQDWKLVNQGTITITADAGIDATEALVLDRFPFGQARVNSLATAAVAEGETVTLSYEAPSYMEYVYVAVRNAQGDYRVKRVSLDTETASFAEDNAATARTRATVASPSVTEIGYSFNSLIAQAWSNFYATVTDASTKKEVEDKMVNYWGWCNSGWNDKVYQINASVVESTIKEADLGDIEDALIDYLPEGTNNTSKATTSGYKIVTEGGKPVTLTPIRKVTNSGGCLYYYYYPKGTTPNVKMLPKYKTGNMEVGNTYSLVYVNNSGECSYTWPADYEIGFAVINNSQETNSGYNLNDIYKSGGVTTTTTTESSSSPKAGQVFKRFALANGETFTCGTYPNNEYQYQDLKVRFGRGSGNDFKAAKSNTSVSGFTAYTEGNDSNGSLTEDGTTVYFMQCENWYTGGKDILMRVGIVINGGKKLHVYELGNAWNSIDATTGTPVEGIDGKIFSEKYIGDVLFPVKTGYAYAIWAEGSELGFFGVEYAENVGSGGSQTVSETSAVEYYNNIPSVPEYYGDGSLNTAIHGATGLNGGGWSYSSNTSAPHDAVFNLNGKAYLGFEDWTGDWDFNDLLFQIDGVKAPEAETICVGDDCVQSNVYTYAFEDNELTGDYDMNDVVLQAKDYDCGTKLEISLVAAGATYNIEVYLGDTHIKFGGKDEIHAGWGVPAGTMVNTGGTSRAPVKAIIDKPAGFNYATADFRLKVLSTGKEVSIARTGGNPCGIVIPTAWQWPTERTNITVAYPSFAEWATDVTQAKDWYNNPADGLVTNYE